MTPQDIKRFSSFNLNRLSFYNIIHVGANSSRECVLTVGHFDFVCDEGIMCFSLCLLLNIEYNYFSCF